MNIELTCGHDTDEHEVDEGHGRGYILVDTYEQSALQHSKGLCVGGLTAINDATANILTRTDMMSRQGEPKQ